MRRIPHRGNMLLVDKIIDETPGQAIVCRKIFDSDEAFFDGHFPGNPIVPGVIQCECCLQAGAVLLSGGEGDDDDGLLPVATRLDSVKFKKMVRPGDVVDITVTLNETVSNAYYLTGKLTVGGKIAARLDFTVTLSPKPESSQTA